MLWEATIYAGRDWDIQDVGESELFGLDFVNDLPTGDSLSTVAWTLTVAEGTDPAPNTHLDGLPGTSGTIALQRLSGLLPNVRYILKATASTALGNTIILYSHVACENPS